MKVLFFIDTLTSGGKERRFTELLKGIRRTTDIECEIVLMNRDVHYKEIFDLKIPIHYLIRRTRKDLAVFRKFYKICKEVKPDIVHCWDDMTAVIAALVCKLQGIRLINGMVIDTPTKKNIFNKYWLRAKLTFPFSDAVVGNSKAGIKGYNPPSNKAHVIHNGFAFERIAKLRETNEVKSETDVGADELVIGMVAAFADRKDYKTYLEAAQLVLKNHSNIVFFLVGADTDSIQIKEKILPEYLKNFRTLGKRSGVESLVNVMDICVLATFREGISNSIMEYMALGKPVIATDGGGTNEIVEDLKTGFLTKVSDPFDMAEKMELLITNRQLREEMGDLGRKRIQNFFLLESMTNKYVELYASLVRGGL